MTLQILQSKVLKIDLKQQQEGTGNAKQSFGIKYEIIYDQQLNDVFAVSFDVSLSHPKEFMLSVNYITWFKTNELITPEFRTSHFPNENAPAIAFPFLRSFISTVTLNAGYQAAILPSINFIELRKQQENAKKS